MKNLGKQLQEWRARTGLSQAGAAAKLGIPKATLENWEQERNAPRGLALAALLSKIKPRKK